MNLIMMDGFGEESLEIKSSTEVIRKVKGRPCGLVGTKGKAGSVEKKRSCRFIMVGG